MGGKNLPQSYSPPFPVIPTPHHSRAEPALVETGAGIYTVYHRQIYSPQRPMDSRLRGNDGGRGRGGNPGARGREKRGPGTKKRGAAQPRLCFSISLVIPAPSNVIPAKSLPSWRRGRESRGRGVGVNRRCAPRPPPPVSRRPVGPGPPGRPAFSGPTRCRPSSSRA